MSDLWHSGSEPSLRAAHWELPERKYIEYQCAQTHAPRIAEQPMVAGVTW